MFVTKCILNFSGFIFIPTASKHVFVIINHDYMLVVIHYLHSALFSHCSQYLKDELKYTVPRRVNVERLGNGVVILEIKRKERNNV